MPKHKEYVVTLLTPGVIDQNLHYGPFSRYWWLSREKEVIYNTEIMYPIRIGMKTFTVINECDFITIVEKHQQNNIVQPGYKCSCNGIISEICTSSTDAITSVYQKLFSSKTKHSGPLVMGFN